MKVNARTEEFEHLELFDKPALFTNGRIDHTTVPEGWYAYDFRGSDDDPGELYVIEEKQVVVNHSGTALMPEKLEFPSTGRLYVEDELGFVGDVATLEKFCQIHGIEYPAPKFIYEIKPASPDEAGVFFSQHPAEDERLGCIGHVRMDFGKNGNEFWHTWWPRGPEELNSPGFKAELQKVVDELRQSVLKNRIAMERFCYGHGGKIPGGWVQNYGYVVETERYRYCLRCDPSPGTYNGYLTCFDLDVQRQNMAQTEQQVVGRVSFISGETKEFTDPEEYVRYVREELPYRPTTGFQFETLTDDPAIRKAVDDLVYDLYGEENPRPLEDYKNGPEQGMQMGGM